jgi:hypothetical protein
MPQPAKKLTDAQLRACLDHRPADRRNVKDGAIPGLALRLGPSMMTFTLLLRVKGEGRVSERGQKKNGKLQRVTWGIDEDKIKREVNPAANMEKNLPKKKKGERVLSLEEAREAWRAAGDLGYPFGPVYQLDLLTGNRRGE